jgi:hypothetical protein
MPATLFLILVLTVANAPFSDCAVPPGSSPAPDSVIVLPSETPCVVGDLVRADDGTFENGYAGSHDGVQPPFFGDFGEGYDLGPNVGRNEALLDVDVDGAFTLGYWPSWPGQEHGFYCAADLDGVKHHCWTCIAPGLEHPSGGQDPSIVWGETASLGLGVRFSPRSSSIEDADSDPIPPAGPTWGAVKALFGK